MSAKKEEPACEACGRRRWRWAVMVSPDDATSLGRMAGLRPGMHLCGKCYDELTEKAYQEARAEHALTCNLITTNCPTCLGLIHETEMFTRYPRKVG